MIRIILVDDQDLVRAGLERILGTEEDLAIVAQCSDGAQAIAAVEEHGPDVVVMDIRMRVMNGIDATRRIRDADGPPVLILTTFDDDETLWAAIDAGAAGFVLKDAPAVDLIRAVRTVASGAAWLDPQVTPRVLAIYRTTVLPQAREQERAAQLTDREHDVLRLIAGGSTNTEIAAGAARQRGHGEEPRRVDLHQARRARPGRGDRVRLPARDRVTPRSELTTGPSSDDTGGGRPYRRLHDCAVGDPATHQALRRPRRRRRRRPHRSRGRDLRHPRPQRRRQDDVGRVCPRPSSS